MTNISITEFSVTEIELLYEIADWVDMNRIDDLDIREIAKRICRAIASHDNEIQLAYLSRFRVAFLDFRNAFPDKSDSAAMLQSHITRLTACE